MKSKRKFVLAGLFLLAITGLLALAGCKNDTVPETPATELVSITVTPPTKTVYSVGDTFDKAGMKVTATYDDGEKREVSGWTTDFTTVAAEKGLAKTVTVSYKEGDSTQTATFIVDVASYKFTETVEAYEYPSGQTGTASPQSIPAVSNPIYKKFGDWPQTIMADGVTVDETKSKTMGGLTYCLGSDGNHYVEAEENAYGSGTEYQYSNGEQAGQGGGTTKWFKVEPIVWRVLNKDYTTTGTALLLAERILTGGIQWADSRNNYKGLTEESDFPELLCPFLADEVKSGFYDSKNII